MWTKQVQFVEGEDRQFKLEDFHPVNKTSRPFGEVQHSRGLFCQKFNETVRGLQIETEEDSDDSDEEFNRRDPEVTEEEAEESSYDNNIDTSVDVDCTKGQRTMLEVLPKVPAKTEYLFEGKIVGKAVEVHINNIVEPGDSRKVRMLDTKHVNFLEESFRSSPGANFHLLAGNLIKGNVDDVKKEGRAEIEAIGGNHTRAALKLLYAKGIGESTVLVTVYKNLTDIEALKIGAHHNLLAERSKEMSFVDKVGVVKKLVDQGTTNLYKTIENIFGVKDKTQAKNRFKFHVKLSKMPQDIFDMVMEIGLNWTGKKEFNQVTVRTCFYLPDEEVREALHILKDVGEAEYKEYVAQKREKKKTSNSQHTDTSEKQQPQSANWQEKYKELKQKYQSLEEQMSALREENVKLREQIKTLKNKGDKKLEEKRPVLVQTPKEKRPVLVQTPKEKRPVLVQTPNQKRPVLVQTPKEKRPVLVQTPNEKRTSTLIENKQQKRKNTPKEVCPAVNKQARVENEKVQFQVGEKVWALYPKDATMYPARVKAFKDNSFTVVFEEDKIRMTCEAEDLRPFDEKNVGKKN